ncbi:MAG: DNA-directed RNA polymerase [Candidatus Altiarchaeota archaeon]|nr:DNA-directed RNA polymerase [Candidatus Altiarchaeota archaeon]
MYYKIELRDSVRVPPNMFGKDQIKSMKEILDKEYVGRIDQDLGIVVATIDVKDIGDSYIIPGDGGAYYDTTFTMLVYKPKLQEVVEGEFKEIAEFGAFVSIGPIDGLVHVSQIMEDFVNYNEKEGQFNGKESKRALKLGDVVRARVVTISKKSTLLDTKIGLTMRQPSLGSLEWLEKEAKEATKKSKEKKAEKKDKKEAKK